MEPLFGQQGQTLRLGVGMSGISYVGDLTEAGGSLLRFQPGGEVSLQFARNKRLWSQLRVGFGRFTEQADGPAFATPQAEISPNRFVQTSLFSLEYGLNVRFIRRGRLQPYAGTGAGLLFYQPRDAEGNFLAENIFTRREEEVYGTATFYLPLRAGMVLKLNEQIALGISYTYKATTTDYLDNIGLLGSRKGKDALHQLQFSLYLDLGPKPAARRPQELPPLRPLQSGPRVAAQQQGPKLMEPNWQAWEETALLLRKFVYYPVQQSDDFYGI
ncbi:MAG: hypothetical protein D6730_14070, partial [Bacteroidetes bacterium]